GTPLPQDASFDELRLKDVPRGTVVEAGQRLDPLLHFVGRSHVVFTDEPGGVTLQDLKPFINRSAQTATSTTGELKLNYGKGLLVIDAPQVQGASGALKVAGKIALSALTIESDLDLGHIVAVALDVRPLTESRRMLLQVMSEERASGFETETIDATTKRIKNIGRDPWQVKRLSGAVSFQRADAAKLKATPLDFTGRPAAPTGPAKEIKLRPTTLYYLVEA